MKVTTLEGVNVTVRWQFIENAPVLREGKPMMIKLKEPIYEKYEDEDGKQQSRIIHEIGEIVPVTTTETKIFIEKIRNLGEKRENVEVLYTTSVKKWHLDAFKRDKARRFALEKVLNTIMYPIKKPTIIIANGESVEVTKGDSEEIVNLAKKGRKIFWDAYNNRNFNPLPTEITLEEAEEILGVKIKISKSSLLVDLNKPVMLKSGLPYLSPSTEERICAGGTADLEAIPLGN